MLSFDLSSFVWHYIRLSDQLEGVTYFETSPSHIQFPRKALQLCPSLYLCSAFALSPVHFGRGLIMSNAYCLYENHFYNFSAHPTGGHHLNHFIEKLPRQSSLYQISCHSYNLIFFFLFLSVPYRCIFPIL